MASRYAEQSGRYAEQLNPELLRMATTLVAMRSSQAILGPAISRYAYSYLDIYQAAAHLLLLRPRSAPLIAALAVGRPTARPRETEPQPGGNPLGYSTPSSKASRKAFGKPVHAGTYTRVTSRDIALGLEA